MKIERMGGWPPGTAPEVTDGVPARFRRGCAPPVSAFGAVLTLWGDEAERAAGVVIGASRTAAFDTQELDWVGLQRAVAGVEEGGLRIVLKYRLVLEPAAVIHAQGCSPGAREWIERAARSLAEIAGVPYREIGGHADG